jgi:coproporphyrinogen III oxidase
MEEFKASLFFLQQIIREEFQKKFGDDFLFENWSSSLGSGRTGVCQGSVIEKAGANVSFIKAPSLPQSASVKRPTLVGKPYEAVGLSIVLHPFNPNVPTAHFNIRCFEVTDNDGRKICWFGGGFDLTPYLPFPNQVIIWHRRTKDFLDSYDKKLYPSWKEQCDNYFYIKHRNEHRGVGGIFFDDFLFHNKIKTIELGLGLANLFIDLYLDILEENKNIPFSEKQKEFQLWRRGRYVEFNLLYDRGTLFGLQSQGRIESILLSLPPVVQWTYEGDRYFKELNDSLLNILKPRQWALMHCDHEYAP